MTKEEFSIKEKQLQTELYEMLCKEDKKREELNHLREEYCQHLCEEYHQYKGKKLKVTFERKTSGRFGERVEKKECVGFLTGFEFSYGYPDGIFGTLVKVKKDGQPSKVELPAWDVMPWEFMTSIETLP